MTKTTRYNKRILKETGLCTGMGQTIEVYTQHTTTDPHGWHAEIRYTTIMMETVQVFSNWGNDDEACTQKEAIDQAIANVDPMHCR